MPWMLSSIKRISKCFDEIRRDWCLDELRQHIEEHLRYEDSCTILEYNLARVWPRDDRDQLNREKAEFTRSQPRTVGLPRF